MKKDIFVQLAYDTIKMFLLEEKIPQIKDTPLEIATKRAACFVSLKEKDGKLRGCIGTIRPVSYTHLTLPTKRIV